MLQAFPSLIGKLRDLLHNAKPAWIFGSGILQRNIRDANQIHLKQPVQLILGLDAAPVASGFNP
jgi:hypothetical protein